MADQTVEIGGIEHDVDDLEAALDRVEEDGEAVDKYAIVGNVVVAGDGHDDSDVVTTTTDNLVWIREGGVHDFRDSHHYSYKTVSEIRDAIAEATTSPWDNFVEAVEDAVEDSFGGSAPRTFTVGVTEGEGALSHSLAVSVSTSKNVVSQRFFEEFEIDYINGGEGVDGAPFSTYDDLERPDRDGTKEPVTFFLKYDEAEWE